ncbi:MAG: hypothetical protein SangKO_027890 [Sandaracinaceae bacterium]
MTRRAASAGAILLATVAFLGCEIVLSEAPMKARDGGTLSCECWVDGFCVLDMASDPNACGRCGNVCAADEACVEGACVLPCPAGEARCGEACVDPGSDPAHCGGCGMACLGPCEEGECLGTRCGPGEAGCGGVCVAVLDDPDHCGACEVVCAPEERCSAGACEPGCRAPLIDCGGVCVDLEGDVQHCGACGQGCDGTCDGGRCAGTLCEATERLCDPTEGCVDVSTNVARCGDCDAACGTGEECVEGRCLEPCEAPELRCGAGCVDPLTDADHCGACGQGCERGEECLEGTCGTCPAGTTVCDGRCVDTDTDFANCGGCGDRCAPGVLCEAGVCDCPLTRTCGGACASAYHVDHCAGRCGDACTYCDTSGRCRLIPSGGRCPDPPCPPPPLYLRPDPIVGAHLYRQGHLSAALVCPSTLTTDIARVACQTYGFGGGAVVPGDISELVDAGYAGLRLFLTSPYSRATRLEDLGRSSMTCPFTVPQVIRCDPPS